MCCSRLVSARTLLTTCMRLRVVSLAYIRASGHTSECVAEVAAVLVERHTYVSWISRSEDNDQSRRLLFVRICIRGNAHTQTRLQVAPSQFGRSFVQLPSWTWMHTPLASSRHRSPGAGLLQSHLWMHRLTP